MTNIRRDRPFGIGKKPFHLPIEMAVLVPSTTKKSKSISKAAYHAGLSHTQKYLGRVYGGYTSVSARGGYVSHGGKLIRERVGEVKSFTTRKEFMSHRKGLYRWLRSHGKQWGQENMGYEYEGDLYYV